MFLYLKSNQTQTSPIHNDSLQTSDFGSEFRFGSIYDERFTQQPQKILDDDNKDKLSFDSNLAVMWNQ